MRSSVLLLAVFVTFASGTRTQGSDGAARGSSYRSGGTDRDRESERLSGHIKAVRVKGELMCGSAPASGVRVKLWASETGTLIAFILSLKMCK